MRALPTAWAARAGRWFLPFVLPLVVRGGNRARRIELMRSTTARILFGWPLAVMAVGFSVVQAQTEVQHRLGDATESVWLAQAASVSVLEGEERRVPEEGRSSPETVDLDDSPTTELPAVFRFAVDPARPDRILAAAVSQGLYESTDGGLTWTRLAVGTEQRVVVDVAFAPSDPRTVYATYGADISLSRDGGSTWEHRPLPYGLWHYPRTIAVHPTDPDLIVVGTTGGWSLGILQSMDAGNTWNRSHYGGQWNHIKFAPLSDSILFATELNAHSFLRSVDYGESWAAVEIGRVWGTVGISSSKPERVYVGVEADDGKVRVQRSSLDALDWKEVSLLPFVESGEGGWVLPDPHTPIRLAASTPVGVLVSEDEGVTWHQMSTTPARFMAFDPHDVDRLWVASTVAEEGIYPLDLAELSSGNEVAPTGHGLLLETYPNPALRNVVVRFRASAGSRVTLDVYDLIGRHVAGIYDDYSSGNETEVDWNARGSSMKEISGTYIIVLRSGHEIASVKIVVL
jgi:hypothetical protein